MVRKLENKDVQSNLEQRVEELINIESPNLWKSFQDSILITCVEVWQYRKMEKGHGGRIKNCRTL